MAAEDCVTPDGKTPERFDKTCEELDEEKLRQMPHVSKSFEGLQRGRRASFSDYEPEPVPSQVCPSHQGRRRASSRDRDTRPPKFAIGYVKHPKKWTAEMDALNVLKDNYQKLNDDMAATYKEFKERHHKNPYYWPNQALKQGHELVKIRMFWAIREAAARAGIYFKYPWAYPCQEAKASHAKETWTKNTQIHKLRSRMKRLEAWMKALSLPLNSDESIRESCQNILHDRFGEKDPMLREYRG